MAMGLMVSFLAGAMLSGLVIWQIALRRMRRLISRQRGLLDRTRRVEKLAELGVLVGHLAHEIRNPLSTVKVNLKLLGEDIADLVVAAESTSQNDEPKGMCHQLGTSSVKLRRQLRKIETISKETDRLTATLNDFMKYAGKIELQLARHDLNELVDDLVDFYEPQAHSSSVQLRFSPSKMPLPCRIDESLVKQAILNLFINATQAMTDGGELIVRTSGRPGDTAQVEIIDTGLGIDADSQKKVFDVYYTTRAGGTGLGLPMCQRIIEEHHGHIELFSEPGKGSRFTVILPLDKEML